MLFNPGGAAGSTVAKPPLGRRVNWRRLPGPLRFGVGFLPALVFYLVNAHERFGGWWDKSLWLWYQVDAGAVGVRNGPFSLHYLPLNLYTALFMGPSYGPQFPWIFPTVNGQSLLTTSPALLLALRSGDWRLWLAVALSMAASMLVYSNGVAQVGARYWLLALPFLLMLMAEQSMDRLGKILIGTSVVLMVYEMWFVRMLT